MAAFAQTHTGCWEQGVTAGVLFLRLLLAVLAGAGAVRMGVVDVKKSVGDE